MADGSTPSDDAETELFGAPAPAQAPGSSPAIDPNTDAAVRIAAAEAGPGGYAAVVNVARNRATKSGKSLADVVAEPGAFEGYGNKTYTALKPGSPQYRAILNEIAPVLSGKESPVGDADAYYSPKGQAAKGRQPPAWAVGQAPVANIGGNQFYRAVYHAGAPVADPTAEHELFGAASAPATSTQADPAADPLQSSAADATADAKRKAFMDYAARFPGWNPPADAAHLYTPVDGGATVDLGRPGSFMVAPIKGPNGEVISPRHPVTDAQAAALLKLQADKKFDPGQPSGSAANPYVVSPGQNYPLNRGEWYLPVDSSEPRQVGDAELLFNKQLELSRTPEGRAALDAARQATSEQYGDPLNARASYGGGVGRALDQFGSYVDTALDNGAARLGVGQARPYSPQQASDAAYVADSDRLAREGALVPGKAGANRLIGSMVETAPALELGGALTAPVRTALGPVGTFIGGEAGAGGQGAGNLLLRALSKGAAGGIEGGTAGLITSDDPSLKDFATGAAFGGALRGGGTLATAAGRATGNAFLGAGSLDPATRNLLQSAQDQGINLRAGQMSSNPFIRTMDSELSKMPFTGYAESDAAQRQAFTRAVAKTIGEDAHGLTPEVMSRARSRIGQVFDDVAARTSIPDGAAVATRLSGVLDEARGVLPDSDVSPLAKQVENISSAFGGDGTMSGESYQALTRKGGALDRAMQSSNPNIRYYAGQMRDVLDDALENNAKPEDLARLRQARLQWKNMRTVEDLAEKAGPDGAISPALLKNAVRKSYGDYAYTGAGDIGQLGEIGQRFLKEPPNSGTAQRLGVRNLLTGSGLLGGGATAAEIFHNPIPAVVGGLGAAGSVAAPPIAARLLNNPMTRSAFVGGSTPSWVQAAGNLLPAARIALLPAGVEETNRLLALPPPRPQAAQYSQ